MLKFNSKHVPPDGFRYVFPEDGFIAHAWDPYTWLQVARDHLRVNNMPEPPNLQDLMEEQLCQTLDPGWCLFDNENRPRPNINLEWGDIKGGLITFATWLTTGRKLVSQDEADRRALICSKCYLNVNVSGCSHCQTLAKEVIGDRKSKYDFALKACAVCKCLLRAKVHFPISTLDKATDLHQEMYPSHCWLKKSSINYKPEN
jgi:hypothetical protein